MIIMLQPTLSWFLKSNSGKRFHSIGWMTKALMKNESVRFLIMHYQHIILAVVSTFNFRSQI